jgi:DNA repair exonuclease SbcCD ATPase subunit
LAAIGFVSPAPSVVSLELSMPKFLTSSFLTDSALRFDKSKLIAQQRHLELHAQLKKSIGSSERPSKKRQAELKQLIENLEEQQELQSSVKKRKLKVKELSVSIKEIQKELNEIYQELFSKDFDKPFELDSAIESKYLKAKRAKEDHDELTSEVESLRKALKALPKAKLTKAELTSKVEDYKQQIKTYSKLKEHIDDDKCPTCGSTVDLTTLKKIALEAKAKITDLEQQLKYIETKAELESAESKVGDYDASSFTKLQKQYIKIMSN